MPNWPSQDADITELADFAELLCWANTSTSVREIAAYLGRIDDNDSDVGCEDSDDENAELLDEVMNEIERRESACSSGYPFTFKLQGTVLRCPVEEPEETQSIVYLYLLLSTRLNMKKNRKYVGIDGTNLLEGLSAHALKTYLGPDKAQCFVFGTSNEGNFKNKINKLCSMLGEGSGFRSLDKKTVKKKDDMLDVVAWIPFADRRPGQIVFFGQCKTGTNWKEDTSQLQPGEFVSKWMHEPFLVIPTRIFCISEALDRSDWKNTNIDAGIVFDRCRLVENCIGLPEQILSNIRTWMLEAKKTVNASFSKPR